MKRIKLTFAFLALLFGNPVWAQNIPGTDLVEKTFELNSVEKDKPSLTLESLLFGIDKMNAYIGSYPPQFKDEAERQSIYKEWLILISEAEAYAKVHKGAGQSQYAHQGLAEAVP